MMSCLRGLELGVSDDNDDDFSRANRASTAFCAVSKNLSRFSMTLAGRMGFNHWVLKPKRLNWLMTAANLRM